jgi:DNA invertase Pin-like site-specific DNA recombinase
VILSARQRSTLEGSIASGRAPARRIAHARILLKADEGGDAPGRAWTDTEIVRALEVSRSTVYRVRTRFAREGLRPPSSIAPLGAPSPRSSTASKRRT